MRKLQLICCAATLSLAAGAAEAARIVVLEVRGDDTSDFEDMLVESLKTQHDVVESRAFDRAARREGVGDDLDAGAIARVARSLDAVAVLDPLLAKRDGEWEFTIRVRGQDGKVKRKMKIELDAPRLGAKGKKKVGKAVMEVVDEVLASDVRVGKSTGKAKGKAKRGREVDDDVEVADDRGRKRAAARARDEAPADRKTRGRERDDEDDDDDDDGELGDDDDSPLPARRGGRDDEAEDDDEDDDEDDEDEDDDEDRPRKKRPRAGGREIRRAGVMVEVGSSMVTRKLTFSSRAAFDEAPRGYPGSPAPAAHVAVELYPVAIALPKNPGAILGVYAEYEKVMGLTTRTSQAMDVPMPTRQLRWVIGGKLRYSFGKSKAMPTIYAGFGVGRRAFIVDRSALPTGASLDLPDVDYRLMEPQVGLRLPVGTERIALSLGGRALLFKSAGGIQAENEYGAAKVTGVEGEGMIDAAITTKVLLRLRGSFTQIGYDFSGNGEQTYNRDGNPDTPDVGGAMDRWVSATAALAFVY